MRLKIGSHPSDFRRGPAYAYIPARPLRSASYELHARGYDCVLHRTCKYPHDKKPIRAPIMKIQPLSAPGLPSIRHGHLRIANGDWAPEYTIDTYRFRISATDGTLPLIQEIHFRMYKPGASRESPDIDCMFVSYGALARLWFNFLKRNTGKWGITDDDIYIDKWKRNVV